VSRASLIHLLSVVVGMLTVNLDTRAFVVVTLPPVGGITGLFVLNKGIIVATVECVARMYNDGVTIIDHRPRKVSVGGRSARLVGVYKVSCEVEVTCGEADFVFKLARGTEAGDHKD